MDTAAVGMDTAAVTGVVMEAVMEAQVCFFPIFFYCIQSYSKWLSVSEINNLQSED